jgi:hypothetical protein
MSLFLWLIEHCLWQTSFLFEKDFWCLGFQSSRLRFLQTFQIGIKGNFQGISNVCLLIKQSSFSLSLSGTCNKTQTDNLRYLPGGNITVFAYMLHAHLLGRKIWTVHYRNNAPIGYLGNNLAYDFVCNIIHLCWSEEKRCWVNRPW